MAGQGHEAGGHREAGALEHGVEVGREGGRGRRQAKGVTKSYGGVGGTGVRGRRQANKRKNWVTRPSVGK